MYQQIQNLRKVVFRIKQASARQAKEIIFCISRWATSLLSKVLKYGQVSSKKNQFVHSFIRQSLMNHMIYQHIQNSLYSMCLVKKYEKTFNTTISPPENQNIQNFNRISDFTEITNRDQQLISSAKFNECIIKISKNEIIMNNSNCVRCSTIFLKDSQIINNNPCLPNLIALSEKEGFNRVSLQRYMASILNSGGGVILVGAQNKNKAIKVTGINFKDLNTTNQRIKQITQSIQNLKPLSFFFSIQYVQVRNNFIQNKNNQQEKPRFIFRITILPYQQKNTNYLEINLKGYHTKYEFYKLDSQKKLMKYNQENLSSLIIQNYYSSFLRTNKPNIHQFILCYRPQSNFLNSYPQTGYIFNQEVQQQSPTMVQQTQQFQNIFNDEPKFPYPLQTLLTVGSLKHQRYIKQLITYLKKKKFAFQIIKPFQNSFKQGSRSIWLISHQQKYNVTKNTIKQYDIYGNITILPVFHTLQIERSKLSQYNQKILQKRFKQRYPEGFRLQWKNVLDVNNSVVTIGDYLFNNYTHSIYAYLLFQELKLWPYYVQDNTNYKKKSKKIGNQN